MKFKAFLTENGVMLLERRFLPMLDKMGKKVDDCIERSNELLEQITLDASPIALAKIAEALSLSAYSERLLQLKAEFLFLLRKYEEVIKLCEQTLPAGEG